MQSGNWCSCTKRWGMSYGTKQHPCWEKGWFFFGSSKYFVCSIQISNDIYVYGDVEVYPVTVICFQAMILMAYTQIEPMIGPAAERIQSGDEQPKCHGHRNRRRLWNGTVDQIGVEWLKVWTKIAGHRKASEITACGYRKWLGVTCQYPGFQRLINIL